MNTTPIYDDYKGLVCDQKSQSWMISENEVTPETIFKQRRDILLKLGITATALPFAAQSKAGLLDLLSSDEPSKTVDHRQNLAGLALHFQHLIFR